MHWFIFSRQLTDSGKETVLHKKAMFWNTLSTLVKWEDETAQFWALRLPGEYRWQPRHPFHFADGQREAWQPQTCPRSPSNLMTEQAWPWGLLTFCSDFRMNLRHFWMPLWTPNRGARATDEKYQPAKKPFPYNAISFESFLLLWSQFFSG